MSASGENVMTRRRKSLFDLIAPAYGLFYHWQVRHYQQIVAAQSERLGLDTLDSCLDVGCGSGALASVFASQGLSVTGADPAFGMLRVAKRKTRHTPLHFIQADAGRGLPFADKQFDLSIASYVAHGLNPPERIHLYKEMSRVSRHYVVIYDYNQVRSLPTTLVEWLENGDYFRFIKTAEHEMRDCLGEMRACFSKVEVVNVSPRAAWYLCTPQPLP